jgi:membrane protein
MNLKGYLRIFKGTLSEFGEDKVLRLSGALAYYAMFSIGPLLVIAIGLAGLVFGRDAVRGQLEQQLQSVIGPGATKMIASMMSAQSHGAGLITTILGILALLFGASGVFGQLQDALNTIWGVKSKPGHGFLDLLRARFLSLTMVLGTGFLLLISMALSTFLTAFTGVLGSYLPIPEAVAHVLNFVVSFAVISLLFAMIFKVLPDVIIPFKYVWIGAIGTALLFTIGKYLLALYLGRESTASAYGAAGSVIIILMWVYYASLILFFGAEFTQVYARTLGARILPKHYAIPVTQEARAEQGLATGQSISQARPDQLHQPPPTKAVAHAFRVERRKRATSSPGVVVKRDPWGFLVMMAGAGLAGGLLLRFKMVRKGLRLYGKLRRAGI